MTKGQEHTALCIDNLQEYHIVYTFQKKYYSKYFESECLIMLSIISIMSF